MARPRTVSTEKNATPIGPFRASVEHRAALAAWARRRGLLGPKGEPVLADAFRDLCALAAAIDAFDDGAAPVESLASLLDDIVKLWGATEQHPLAGVARALARYKPLDSGTSPAVESSPTKESSREKKATQTRAKRGRGGKGRRGK